MMSGKARLRYTTGQANIVVDGNSMVYGMGAARLSSLSPISDNATPVTFFGVSGQQISQMDGAGASDVDGAWVSGKSNILIAWEGTNSIYYGASGSSAADQMLNYLANRKSFHPWKTMIVLCIPRYQARQGQSLNQTEVDAYNAEINAYNTKIRNQYKQVADLISDPRQAGSPYADANFPDYTLARWTATSAYWGASDTVHPSGAGYDIVAAQWARDLRRMPKR